MARSKAVQEMFAARLQQLADFLVELPGVTVDQVEPRLIDHEVLPEPAIVFSCRGNVALQVLLEVIDCFFPEVARGKDWDDVPELRLRWAVQVFPGEDILSRHESTEEALVQYRLFAHPPEALPAGISHEQLLADDLDEIIRTCRWLWNEFRGGARARRRREGVRGRADRR